VLRFSGRGAASGAAVTLDAAHADDPRRPAGAARGLRELGRGAPRAL